MYSEIERSNMFLTAKENLLYYQTINSTPSADFGEVKV